MSSWIDILILLFLILLNGAFSMSEIALVTSRRGKLKAMEEDKVKGAAKAIELGADPTRALSTIQVGITSIGILSGIVGESALAEPMAQILASFGMAYSTAKAVGVVVVVVLVTYFSIVLGELVPKRFGQLAPERIACRVAPVIHFLSLVASPFVKLLSSSTHWIMRRCGADQAADSGVTEEEIHAMIDEGAETGVIESDERDMVRNVFRLDDRQVGSLMTPRSAISWINLEDTREVNIEKIKSEKRSRLPVCEGSLDNVKGFCTTKILLQQILENGKPNFRTNLAPATYVPESLTGMELLEHFRRTDSPIALVVDEYGEVQGLVTPRDVLEAIVGEFKPEMPGEAWVTRRDDGSLLLDGLIPIPELKDVLAIKTVPDEEDGRYQTLAGMLMLLLGRLPREGDVAEWLGWRFEVVDMDGRRIDKVIVTRGLAAKARAAGAAVGRMAVSGALASRSAKNAKSASSNAGSSAAAAPGAASSAGSSAEGKVQAAKRLHAAAPAAPASTSASASKDAS